MSVTLNRLQHVLAVARHRSFSRAAEELRISQPALSRSISLLEDSFGLKVFDRDRGGVSITPTGRKVIIEGQALIKAARTFDHNVKILSGEESGRLAIGVSPALASLILPDLGSYLFNKRPRAGLHTSIRAPHLLLEELKRDEIELLYCPSFEIEQGSDLDCTVLTALNFRFVCGHDHPLASHDDVYLSDISRFPIATTSGLSFGASIRPESFFICDNDDISRGLLRSCDAIWLCCPDRFATPQDREGLHILEVRDGPELTMQTALVRRKRKLVSPMAADAVDFVERLLAAKRELNAPQGNW